MRFSYISHYVSHTSGYHINLKMWPVYFSTIYTNPQENNDTQLLEAGVWWKDFRQSLMNFCPSPFLAQNDFLARGGSCDKRRPTVPLRLCWVVAKKSPPAMVNAASGLYSPSCWTNPFPAQSSVFYEFVSSHSWPSSRKTSRVLPWAYSANFRAKNLIFLWWC